MGVLCALLGGSLGVAFHLISYSLIGALNILTGDVYGSDPFTRFFTLSLLLGAGKKRVVTGSIEAIL